MSLLQYLCKLKGTVMDWIGFCGFVCLNRRSSDKILATVTKLKYPSSGTHPSLCTEDIPSGMSLLFKPSQALWLFTLTSCCLLTSAMPCISLFKSWDSLQYKYYSREYTQSSKHTLCKYIIPTASLNCVHWVFVWFVNKHTKENVYLVYLNMMSF